MADGMGAALESGWRATYPAILGFALFNRDRPLGGASHLFERWRQLCGHFECLLCVHGPAFEEEQRPEARS